MGGGGAGRREKSTRDGVKCGDGYGSALIAGVVTGLS